MFAFCYTEVVEETTGRAVRTNRGQGGHAYQLEKALNPASKDQQARKAKEGIPENVPENAMAPQALRTAQAGKNVVTSLLYHY